jgi:GT2 family glycosyltransferase
MRVSLIICTRNRAQALDATLGALRRVVVPLGMEVELVVVDNGSTDATPGVVKSHQPFAFPVLQLQEPVGGKSVALNRALRHATGDILAFIDDDVRPAPHWLTQLTQPIASKTFDAVSGTVAIATHLQRRWMTSLHRAWLASTECIDSSKPETAVGANMAFRRDVFLRVPSFDADLGPGRLGLWEDTLFSLQIRHAGLRLGTAPAAEVEHHFEPSRLQRGAFLKRAQAEGRSSAYVAWHWKHESRPGALRRLAKWYSHLFVKRITRWSQWHSAEGMAEWEIHLLTGIAFEFQYLRLIGTPHNYDKLGLIRVVPSEVAGRMPRRH